MIKCSLCEKEAKTQRGLAKHLSGTKPYGGHELSLVEAAEAAAKAAGAEVKSTPAPEPPRAIERTSGEVEPQVAEAFFNVCLAHVVENKSLPKYQFERIIDFCLGPFLPKIMSEIDGAQVDLVTQEFPIKKPHDNRSTNIDYVLFRHEGGPRPSGWIFLELKTDVRSISHEQAGIYRELLERRSDMTELHRELNEIRTASSQSWKYDEHIERLEDYGASLALPLELIYLAPSAYELDLPAARYRSLTFNDLRECDLPAYEEEWSAFKELALTELAD